MLALKEVSKSFNQFELAVKNVNFNISPGEIFGLVGPNGAGKSTTIKMITGIYPMDQGRIILNHSNLKSDPISVKKQIGYVSDSPSIFLHLKGIEYLNFLRDIYQIPKKQCELKIEELASKFNIISLLKKDIRSYSHGTRQKIVIIGSLLHQPKLWVLDEPLTGLDPLASFTLKELMQEHASAGNSVLFSSHMLDTVEKICNRVGIMNKGEMILSGTLNEIKRKMSRAESLEKLFLELTHDDTTG